MYRFGIELGSWRRGMPPNVAARQIVAFCEALVLVNVTYLATSQVPWLYESGVRYRRDEERAGALPDIWSDVPTILERGFGDCEDLACWRVAELRTVGRTARIGIAAQRRPTLEPLGWGFHVTVEKLSGTVWKTEDPSVALGMNT